MLLLSVDAGTTKSAYVVVDTVDYRIISSGKVDNDELMQIIKNEYYDDIVFEMISSYMNRIGDSTIQTIKWIGRFEQQVYINGDIPKEMKRYEVKTELCGSMKAKDKDIIMYLEMRFGKKTKAKDSWFAGITADQWQAYGLAIAWVDKQRESEKDAIQ